MALWDDLRTEVFTWTNRPTLTAETDLALRTAIRTCHKAAKFWRDLAKVTVSAVPIDTIQAIDMAANFPRMQQIAYVKSGYYDKYYTEADIRDLLDEDGVARTDKYWALGTTLNIRSSGPEDKYEVVFHQYPLVFPTASYTDWMADNHRDAIVLLAAETVLGIVGENEIRAKVSALAAIQIQQLIADNLELTSR